MDGTAVIRGAAMLMSRERGQPEGSECGNVPRAPRSCPWLAWRSRMPEPRQSGSGGIGGERPAPAPHSDRGVTITRHPLQRSALQGCPPGPTAIGNSQRGEFEGPFAFLVTDFALTPVC